MQPLSLSAVCRALRLGLPIALGAFAFQSAAQERLTLSPVTAENDGAQTRFRVQAQASAPIESGTAVFWAVSAREWPAGLVPIYQRKKEGVLRLSRTPPRGMEGLEEPLFFAMANTNEAEFARACGYWECRAVRGDGSQVFFAWELSVSGKTLFGRFDPNSEYRYAYIEDGQVEGTTLQFRVRYARETYSLKGQFTGTAWRGEWRHNEGDETGTWEAVRPDWAPKAGVQSGRAVPLYEWRSADGEAFRYEIDGNELGEGWTQSEDPICRVWVK